MKIGVIQASSQAEKNELIFHTVSKYAPSGAEVINFGCTIDEPNEYSYIDISILVGLLLAGNAVDFVVTGCGTGQGALMACNMMPGVVCGYCIEPSDAYLFLQINNGNALALPYAKGFGWGADVNLKNIFTIAFGSPKGMGYPNEPGRKESQNRNAAKLVEVKAAIAKPLIEGLKAMDQDVVKKSLTPRFLQCFNEGCKDPELKAFVDSLL